MSNPTSANHCPACGAAIPEGAPQGLCPKCLLASVGQTQEIASGSADLHGPPPIEEVAAAFPQLEILELIGMGGMGCVFKARQPKLERFVALKLLPAKFATDAAFRERFSREARVLARLNHPNIVSVFDFGEVGGFFYLLMEFVDGANLRQAMQAGRFTPDQALAIVPKICEALQFAHTEGILHRDIKPENILLDTKGRVKIADFGIAKLVGDPRPITRLTETGAAIGTPQYMAPEQIEHPQEVDHRADIYSLGVVFYEMLTGELPIGRFAPPSERSPMDPRVDHVVMRTLEKEREKRFQSAGDVKTSVEHLTTPQRSLGAGGLVPAFNPTEDFILCPPQLPRMAKAIIVFALVVAPLMWIVGLFMFEPLPEHALVAFVQGALNVLITLVEFVLLVLFAIGGWKLRGLRPSAPGWLRTILWMHLGLIVVAIAGQIWVDVLVAQLIPDAPELRLDVGDGLVIAVILTALVFEISALIWLQRNKALLASFCRAKSQSPPARRGVLKRVFGVVLLTCLGIALSKWPRGREAQPTIVASVSEHAVSVHVTAPPRDTFIVTGIVLSNGVPVIAGDLRAKLWPPSGRERSPFAICWQTLEATDDAPQGAPWEIVVEDKSAGTIAARLRPEYLPRLDWTVSPQVEKITKQSVTREAHAFEIARALQRNGGGIEGAADWSVRLQLQSSPISPTASKRGIDADFVLPANQVATFELVTRSNGVIVPVPDLAAYQVNGTPEPNTGKFILADDPDDLDSLTGLPRWTFGIIGPDGRLASQGLAVPPVPATFTGNLELRKALEPDKEAIEGLSGSSDPRPAYGLRIRTHAFKPKPGLRHTSSGFGTNWMKDAARHLTPSGR